jgi:lipopolysaccharide transport system ATP-binding protein
MGENGMDQPIIRVEKVYKRYQRNERQVRTLRHDAVAMVKGWVGKGDDEGYPDVEPFYALRDISFSVEKGEAVGIVGRNGSGKTTLLRVLSGITRPTSGTVAVEGRYAALIGLGAGFKMDLTGRQNIYLNAAIHGMRPKQVDEVIGSIIGFSELGAFVELPVSRYSSGMMARLAFSIAIHILPDVVFIDEVLAVGDMAFQEKCMDHIKGMKADGHTFIFVSHSAGAVVELCRRTIWLHEGELRMDGESEGVMEAYERFLFEGK